MTRTSGSTPQGRATRARTIGSGEIGGGASAPGIVVRTVRFGQAAFEALESAVAAAKVGNPMAPVTVIVDSDTIGLAVRRRLARGGVSSCGIVNVRFDTVTRLAAEVAGREVAESGAMPLGDVVLASAIRTVLAGRNAGIFARLNHSAATVQSLCATYRELSALPTAVLESLAATGDRAREVTEVVRAVREVLDGRYYDGPDLVAKAVEIVRAGGSTVAALGSVVAYLTSRLAPDAGAFLEALAAEVPVVIVAGVTGDPDADAETLNVVAKYHEGEGDTCHGALHDGVDHATTVVCAPTADVEVLHSVRAVMEYLGDGIPLERIAIVYTADEPYGRLVRDALGAAGVPFNGAGVRRLSGSAAGRFLLGLMSVEIQGWSRRGMIDWLSSVPVRHGGREAAISSWDMLSRDAGIVGGLDQWRERLRALADRLRARQRAAADDRTGEAPEHEADHLSRRIDEIAGFLAFVESLAQRIGDRPSTWQGWARWGRSALAEYLGTDAQRTRWPVEETEAVNSVVSVLDDLGQLDSIEPRPGPADFRSALAATLESPAPATSRWGHGVFVGRLGRLVGTDFDVVVIVGMHDGASGSAPGDDPVLPDRLRAAGDGAVPMRGTSSAERRRQYLSALAAAPVRVCMFARGDQRRGRAQRPSRWWLDSLAAVTGAPDRLYGRDLDRVPPGDRYVVLPSLAATVSRPGEAAARADSDLRSLLEWSGAGRRARDHFLFSVDPVLAARLAARRARCSSVFTRFEGDVSGAYPRSGHAGVTASPEASGATLSPTRLESYATCPRRYFLSAVLGLGEREDPDDTVRIGALDRGRLVHRVLEVFFREEVSRPEETRQPPDRPWSQDDRARLVDIADAQFRAFEEEGLTGREALWAVDRARILRDLLAFLDHDSRYRAETGAMPEAVEVAFDSVGIDLGAAGVLQARGYIDRVDRFGDGSVAVIDYKTGRAVRESFAEDPVVRGTKLQLPIYALAVQGPEAGRTVRSDYWYVTSEANFARQGYWVDEPCRERLTEVLAILAGGIATGSFPARPGEVEGGSGGSDDADSRRNCTFCAFDAICPGNRAERWQAIRGDQLVARYAALADADGSP